MERSRQIGEGEEEKPQPPSPSSSPAHDFSFIISLNPPAEKEKPSRPLAVDLSPADEIFFHGHLLPLHLLSHLPVQRESFNLPIRGLDFESKITSGDKCASANTSFRKNIDDESQSQSQSHILHGGGDRGKSKSFSLPRSRKGAEQQQGDRACHDSRKRKLKFDVLKWYEGLVKPFLVALRTKAAKDSPPLRQPFSLSSGNLRMKKKELRGRRGEVSAPASMKTSPSNSGFLVPSANSTPMARNDSTMEELQAAIQAAIAHCKNSIASQPKTNASCP